MPCFDNSDKTGKYASSLINAPGQNNTPNNSTVPNNQIPTLIYKFFFTIPPYIIKYNYKYRLKYHHKLCLNYHLYLKFYISSSLHSYMQYFLN